MSAWEQVAGEAPARVCRGNQDAADRASYGERGRARTRQPSEPADTRGSVLAGRPGASGTVGAAAGRLHPSHRGRGLRGDPLHEGSIHLQRRRDICRRTWDWTQAQRGNCSRR